MNNREAFLNKLADLMDEYEVISLDVEANYDYPSLEIDFKEGSPLVLVTNYTDANDFREAAKNLK